MPAFKTLSHDHERWAKEATLCNTEEIPKHLSDSANLYRFSYVCITTFFLVLTVTTPRTEILNQFGKLDSESKSILVVLVVASIISYALIQNTNPGYVGVGAEDVGLLSGSQLPIKTTSRHRKGVTQMGNDHEGKLSEHLQSEMVTISIDNEGSEQVPKRAHVAWADEAQSESDEEGSDSDSMWDDSDDAMDILMDDLEPNEQLDAELAGVSESAIPIRAKYCRNSRRVVATYDHYCAILGTCIGERNHFRFWVFLLIQTIANCYCLRVVHSGFHDTEAKVSTWMSYNSHALAAAILLWISLVCIGGLLLFHTFLALANMTSYEFMRSDRISYLYGTRDFDLPFSNGVCYNLRVFVLQDGLFYWLRTCWISRVIGWNGTKEWSRVNWQPVIAIERDAEDVWGNLWENKYWSCC